jgi:hypothetical protein
MLGYAPLESRTKQWAMESLIEGWFPLPGGERHSCKSLPDCEQDLARERCSTHVGRAPNLLWTPGAQPMSARRNGHVRLDTLTHRTGGWDRGGEEAMQ